MLVLIAAGIIAILGISSLAVDVGYWRYQHVVEQTAADSAAIAGAIDRNYNGTNGAQDTDDNVQIAATNSAVSNGFTGSASTIVTITYPSSTSVKVQVQQTQQQFFSKIFGSDFGMGSATAVADVQYNKSACVWQLQQNGSLTVNGGTLTANKCGVLTNGTVKVHQFDIGSLTYFQNDGGYTGPEVKSPTIIMDPCLRIAGCAYITQNLSHISSAGANSWTNIMNGGTYIASPTGVAIMCDHNNNCDGTVDLRPGLYYFYSGSTNGCTSSSTISATIYGNGVTIVNMDAIFSASGMGLSTVPTQPFSSPVLPYNINPSAGVAYYQPVTNTNPITLNGNGKGTSEWNGLFYAPGASFTSNGNPTTFGELVIGDITSNGKDVTVDPTLGIPSYAFPTKVVLTQ